MQQIICKTGCIQSVGGAIDSTAAQYTITAHVKLYNAVQSARLTVVLQKNVQTWSGTWDDIFVFSARRRRQCRAGARNAPFLPACTVQRSSPMCTIRAAFVRILPLCIQRNALFPDADSPTQGQGPGFCRPWPFLIPVKLFRMKYARNAMFQPSPAHIFLWTNKFHPFTIVVLHQKGRKRNHSWENVHSLQDCSSFSPRTI